MNIIIKNSIDNITKCDIIFIEIKKCGNQRRLPQLIMFTLIWDYLISIIVSQSVAADGSLFISIANVKHKCHYIYNGINNSTDTKKESSNYVSASFQENFSSRAYT